MVPILQVTGLYGLGVEQTVSSFVSVQSKGGMPASLLRKYIEELVMPLYPHLSPTVERDQRGRIVKDPIIFKTDSGPGIFKDYLTHIDFLDKCRKLGFIILLVRNIQIPRCSVL